MLVEAVSVNASPGRENDFRGPEISYRGRESDFRDVAT
jgi:hypothetical protein